MMPACEHGAYKAGALSLALGITRWPAWHQSAWCSPWRAPEDSIHSSCGVCFERRRLQQLVILGADELGVCRDCYEAARFGRLGGSHPILFELRHQP